MLTFDQILQAYDSGKLTRSEFIVHVITVLDSVRPEVVEDHLRKKAGDLEAFVAWIDDVAAGADPFLGGRQVHISGEARAAIERFQNRTRG